MWKDLTDRVSELRQNRVVKHLIDSPEVALDAGSQPFPTEEDIDRSYAAADIVTPLSADSSQIAACLAAAQGRDFVIVGPPGTGKSQTIANMIAMCLAARKTVLFVAEKTAALDVVYRRLREHGLGDHCLELHSSKADRKHFLTQLKNSWDKRAASTASDWISLNDRLQVRRDELNAYVNALHLPSRSGLTPYTAMGIAFRGANDHAPVLSWPQKDQHDETRFAELEALAERLGLTYSAVKTKPILQLVQVEEWSNAWQEKLISAARMLGRTASAAQTALTSLSPRLGLAGWHDTNREGLEYFSDFAQSIVATSGEDHTVVLHKDFTALSRGLADLEIAISAYRREETGLSASYSSEVIPRIPVDDIERDWRNATASMWPKSWFAARQVRRLLASYADVKTVDPTTDLPLLRKLQSHSFRIQANPVASTSLAFAGLDTDCTALANHLGKAERLRSSLVQLGQFAGDVQSVATSIASGLKGTINQPQLNAAKDFLKKYQELQTAITSFEELAGQSLHMEDDNFLAFLTAQMEALENSRNLFRDWCSWCLVRNRAIGVGLGPLVGDLERGAILSNQTVQAFRLGYARWWLPLAMDESVELRNFRRFEHEYAIQDFREIDDLVRKHASQKVISSLAHGLPPSAAVPKNSELGTLRHQMELQRPSRSIREMIAAMPASFGKLAPCVLMSPLSIAQYFPTNQALFDIVIFDEASQIPTWDAVGAIARGHQTIVVGDPKQLPPTNFFGRSEDDDDSIPELDRDLESILDEVKASGLPVRNLRWHYRSRHESLIAFSNWHYYDNHLITFPSPVTQDQAVSLHYVPTGVYDRGKRGTRTNRNEARAIASDIRSKLLSWLTLPEQDRSTIGVITFNSQQQALIQDFLDDARREHPELEWYFSDDRIEPIIVKNLENIQGDERDVIYFSITFSRDAAGKLPMTFGAINKDGGERRLNVAVTRARQELKIFSGIRAEDIDLSRSKQLGVKHLKNFLDYAARGAIALPAEDAGSLGPTESPFEEAVAAQLERHGWEVVSQVGVSGFRIDLGVRHPDHPGIFLAGIECDGATYHSSATARDRDKIREQVLRGLGWNILRIWSTDWWFNSEESIERIHSELEELLTTSRVAGPTITPFSGPSTIDGTLDFNGVGSDEEAEGIKGEANEIESTHIADEIDPAETAVLDSFAVRKLALNVSSEAPSSVFRIADLSTLRADPERFFEFSYRSQLQEMVDLVMAAEAPVREDVLCQRIARAHGWQRTGARIRDQIALHLKKFDRTEETTGSFLWLPGSSTRRVKFRSTNDASHRRALGEIALAELADFILSNIAVLEEDDPPLVYARLIQVDRLANPSRARLEEAIAHARQLELTGVALR
jgi:very-short-patch-repair endonuclease